jgi:hypothetical protein
LEFSSQPSFAFLQTKHKTRDTSEATPNKTLPVIKAANANEFGLASYFYSRDMGRIWRVAEALGVSMNT